MSSASPEPDLGEARRPGSAGLRLLGWALLILLLALAAAVHHGIGPAGLGSQGHWYSPTGFFFENAFTAALVDPPDLAFGSLVGPAGLLTIAVLLAARSAVAKALALAAFGAIALFVFYGVRAPSPWQFFGWRGSVALVLVALCFGFSAAAPLLAASWLRRSWPLRVVLYLPFTAFASAFLCNASGTDPELLFGLSPWPVVPVFGLETCALLLAAGWIGVAIAVAGLARAPGRAGRALGIAAGLATPALLLVAGSALGLFPFRVQPRLLVALALFCTLATVLAATLRLADRGPTLARRARRFAVGAALVALPLSAGQVWSFFEYQHTREAQAGEIIGALARYIERESLYPETLEALIEAGDLPSIPRPAIGVGIRVDDAFRYQSFGASYLLEFTATRWVQCAYTPAPIYDEDEDPEADGEEALGASWSCPSRPPELW